MGINITKCTNTSNTTACNRIPEYLVIHYTAGTNSSVGHAKSIANMFANPTREASADFIVDDGSIVQYNPDPTKYYCWAVGGNKYTSLTNTQAAKYYGKATNKNCVSIEICSSKKNTKTLNATDTDWYFTKASVNNALLLSVYLIKLYNIPLSKVIMHNSITGKLCPNPWTVNEAALDGWTTFKKNLSTLLNSAPVYKVGKTYITNDHMYLRETADGNKVKTSGITNNTLKKLITDKNGLAVLNPDSIFTLTEMKTIDKNIWGKIKSGYWLALYYNEEEKVRAK